MLNMKNLKLFVIEITGMLFIILFVYASLTKLIDFQKFNIELNKSPILNTISKEVAFIIPIIELIIGFMFVFKRSQLLALYISFSLMVIFSSYIVAILKYSDYIPCSCGGILQNMNWTQHLIFNVVFILLSAVSVLIYPKAI